MVEQLLSELVLQLLGLPRGLVFEAHRLLHRRDLPVGKFTGPFPHHRMEWPARDEQVDEIAFEGGGGPAQRIQADPVSGLRLLKPGHCSRRGAHARG